MEKQYFVYILANKNNNVLYIGITDNLVCRVKTHKKRMTAGFTSRYYVNKLVYYEEYSDIWDAIHREKRLKNWHRQWKINLVESVNKTWKDLSKDFL